MPIVVGLAPLSGVRLTLNAFVEAKLIVLCLALAFTLATWGYLNFREGVVYTGRSLLPLGAFVLAVLLATVTAVDRRMAFFGDSEQSVGALVFLLCALVCYLTTQLVRDEMHLTVLTSVVVLTATVVASVGILQQLFGLDLTGAIPWGTPTSFAILRGFGTIGNADTYAGFLALPAFLAAIRFARSEGRRDRIMWGSCFVVILTSCVAAQTRGVLVGLLVGGVLYAVAGRMAAGQATAKRRKAGAKAETPAGPAIGIVIGAVVGGFLIAAVLANGDVVGAWHDFAIRFGNIQAVMALGGRIPLWSSALQIAAAHPLLGVGPDSFRLGWYPIRTIAHLSVGAGLVITDPHSVPLLLLATTGIVGLLASAWLLVSALLTGFSFAQKERAARGHASDYDAWLFGVIALSVTFVTSMLASVLLFMFFLGLGVLLAPSLRKSESSLWDRFGYLTLSVISVLAAGALLAFALLSAAGQAAAVGAQGGDADTSFAGITRAASLAPWDSLIRRTKYEAMVQAALDHVFKNKPDAAKSVAAAESALEQAARSEPKEYLFPYRSAVLLIGAGQRLGDAYTAKGVEAGLRGLRLYPNSLELRTGVASGYLQLGEPRKAEDLLKETWDADPNYPQSGVVYARALIDQKKMNDARTVLSVLGARFPDEPSILDLQKQIPPT